MGEETVVEERSHITKVHCCIPPEVVYEAYSYFSVELLRANDPSHMIHRISPTPLLMTVAQNDTLTPIEIALESYSRAREPKALNIIPGGHFDGYTGANFLPNITKQVEFLRDTLCAVISV